MKAPYRAKMYALWYYSIAAGFVLLAINRWMAGEKHWLIALRCAIAAGFVALGLLTDRPKAD